MALQLEVGAYTAVNSPSVKLASGRVALAVTHQGSHRPGRARIRASGSSTNSFAIQLVPEAIRSTYVDMSKEPRCVQHVSLDRVCWSTLRFPPPGPLGRVPQLQRYYQSATTSYRHLAALRFLRLTIPRCHSLFSLPSGRVNRQGLELVTRYLQPGFAEEQKKVGLSQVPGEPQLSVCHVPIRLRRDCLRQTIATLQRGPWYAKSKGSHERSFGAQ